ncbi:MAG TPA: hypothetical protein VGN12_25250 [Pirellulales bacterium]|jgi:hypothetical protein
MGNARHRRLAASVLMAALAAGCGAKPAAPVTLDNTADIQQYPNEEFDNSMVRLLANPSRFHGVKVRVEGYLEVQFEGTAIYLSREDAEHSLTANSFWVDFDEQAIPKQAAQQFDSKYVLLEGRFDKDNHGHMSLFQGAITSVDRVIEKPRRQRP